MPAIDRKVEIVEALEKMMKKEIADKQPFKARAYAKVIKQVKGVEGPITRMEDLVGVDGIGESIKAKIAEILATGHLKQAEEYDNRPEVKAINSLLKVHGIGPAKAKQLVEENGVQGVDDLQKRVGKEPGLLNDKQKMGLKYWEDFDLRIPRAEMDKHAAYVKAQIAEIDKGYVVELTGSYRRGDKDSGDIDVLITHPDDGDGEGGHQVHEEKFKKIIELLTKGGYVTDVFAQGGKKCLAVCKAKRHKHFRRIDFMMTHKHEFPFALLYFTGSGDFNVEMRNWALERGYSLSEHGLKCMRGPREGGFVNAGFTTERQVFEFLGLKYIPPHERRSGVLESYRA